MNRYRKHNSRTNWLIVLLAICLFSTAQHTLAQTHVDEGIRIYKALLPNAEAGDVGAQTTLGLMRLHGDTVPRDLKIARVWLGKAALQNHTTAQFHLGQLLLLDVFNASQSDLKKQLIEGMGWLRRASRSGHHAAQLLYSQTVLESQFENPLGHNKTEAQQHLNACAEEYLPCTHYALQRVDNNAEETDCASNEPCGQKRRLLYHLANTADPTAHYRLSQLDGEDRLFWLRRAARLGHAQASFELAELAIGNTVGLEPEDPAAMALLNSAAQQGIIEAMYLLGRMLHEGTRFPINKPLGLQWLNLAAERGHEPSKQLLEQLGAPADSNPANDKVESAQPTENAP